jgi:outer membrane protein OmpA-like peptidoglycan-associated protein
MRGLALAGTVLVMLFLWGCEKGNVQEIRLPNGNTARVVFVSGDVSYLTGRGGTWLRAEVGDVLDEGTRIRTGENSYCEFVVTSGTIYRMKDHSELELAALPEDRDKNTLLLHFVRGVILSRSEKVAFRSEEEIVTETVTLGVCGTTYRLQADGGGTYLMVRRGKVRVTLNVNVGDGLSRDLRSVTRRIERGTLVKGGFALHVSPDLVDSVDENLAHARANIDRGEPVEQQMIDALMEQVRIRPTLIREEDEGLLDEIDTLLLSTAGGETFYLSPNFDGVQDELVFSTAPYQKRKITGWKLVILDGRYETRQVITNRIPERDEEVVLPPQIRWNLVSKSGGVIEDGGYVYEFYLNGDLQVRGVLVVDTVPPAVAVKVEEPLFSPNGDGIKDTLRIEIDAEQAVDWTCTISTEEGIVVRSIDFGEKPPQVFEWDGRGENGAVLPDGVYELVLSGTDRAGNRAVARVSGITIDVRERQATVNVDTPFFSPNGDGMLDTVTFTPILSDPRQIDTWDLVIQTERGETAKRFRGWGWIPESITWDGAPAGKLATRYPEGLPSGTYLYFLQVYYRSGVNTYSFKRQLVIDNDPPDIDVKVSPSVFSPDGDGLNDTLSIDAVFRDASPIEGWRVVIRTVGGTPFKVFSGGSMSSLSLTWDGVSDKGELVDSAEDYTLEVEATDAAFNTATSDRVPFSIDILVIPTERGLKIRVSNVEFGFNTAELTGERTFDILDRIVRILQKYERYSVLIEGHTDSTGSEEYNLDLSRRRAESVGAYLIEKGVDPDRLQYEGYGSQFPIDSNETPEGRRRNRRVEFLLIRR